MTPDFRQFENSEEIPMPTEYPNTPWTSEATNGEKYNLAFDIPAREQESADMYFAMLIGHCLRYNEVIVYNEKDVLVGRRRLKWCEAFEREREALAWMAFAKDGGTNFDDWGFYRMVNGERVERTTHRDHIWKLFGARLPERITGKSADILERTHIKREKAAKGRGESYWRKGHAGQPEPQKEPSQGALF
jgi:hypothetical protein